MRVEVGQDLVPVHCKMAVEYAMEYISRRNSLRGIALGLPGNDCLEGGSILVLG